MASCNAADGRVYVAVVLVEFAETVSIEAGKNYTAKACGVVRRVQRGQVVDRLFAPEAASGIGGNGRRIQQS